MNARPYHQCIIMCTHNEVHAKETNAHTFTNTHTRVVRCSTAVRSTCSHYIQRWALTSLPLCSFPLTPPSILSTFYFLFIWLTFSHFPIFHSFHCSFSSVIYSLSLMAPSLSSFLFSLWAPCLSFSPHPFSCPPRAHLTCLPLLSRSKETLWCECVSRGSYNPLLIWSVTALALHQVSSTFFPPIVSGVGLGTTHATRVSVPDASVDQRRLSAKWLLLLNIKMQKALTATHISRSAHTHVRADNSVEVQYAVANQPGTIKQDSGKKG